MSELLRAGLEIVKVPASMQILIAVAMLLCAPADHFEVSPNRNYQVADLPISLTITAVDADGKVTPNYCGAADLEGISRSTAGGTESIRQTEVFSAGIVVLEDVHVDNAGMKVSSGPASGEWKPDVRHLPGWLSILPPLAAILLALITRQALIALFAGVYLGAIFVYDYSPLTALLRVFDTHLVAAAADPDHAAILLFTMALGGMVGILARSGGTQALVEVLSKRATTKRSGMVMGWLTGMVVFFDDYANCLLVGNTLRPFTDKLNISREKLSYIVDSTAAPITSVALISTWVGYQLGLIQDLAASSNTTAYDLFLNMLPYSFYSFFTMFFVLTIATTCRDFGPMLAAEKRAATTGKVLRDGAKPMMDKELTEMEAPTGSSPHWSLAIVPIVSVILIVAIGLYASGASVVGTGAGIRTIIANANSYAVLLWAAFGGSLIAGAYALQRRNLNVEQIVDAWVTGCKAMVIAVLILVLAWTIGDICKVYLQTGPWVISQFSPSPALIPAMTFVLCAVIALATGSSFSTMAIVIPIAGPMAWAATGDASGLDPAVGESIRLATLSAVLGGAVFGDHCSPISDTTIMSSMSCASDHIDHVRTQAPYALVCGSAAILLGYLPAGFGISPIITLPLGMLALWAIVRFYGKPSV